MGCGSSPDSPTPCSLFPSQEGCLSPPHTAFPSAAGIPALSLREHVRVCELSHFSCVQLFVTLWTTACQAPLSVGFSRQEYWSGLPCPPPGNRPRDQTCVSYISCTGRRVLYNWRYLGSPAERRSWTKRRHSFQCEMLTKTTHGIETGEAGSRESFCH